MNKKTKNRIIKYSIIILVLIIFIVLGILIYLNLFAGTKSNRLENSKNYKLTKTEIKEVKENLNELDNVDSVDIYTNNRIIKIYLILKEDLDMDLIEEISNESVNKISKKNLKYYDVEIFIESLSKESEIYPIIGYKHKTNESFSW